MRRPASRSSALKCCARNAFSSSQNACSESLHSMSIAASLLTSNSSFALSEQCRISSRMKVAAAELELDHAGATEAMTDGEVLCHTDAAVQLHGTLADVAARMVDAHFCSAGGECSLGRRTVQFQ